jgi:hypothetical protein
MEVMAWRFVAGYGAAASRGEVSKVCIHPGNGRGANHSGSPGIAAIRRPFPNKGLREEEELWER